MRFLFIVVFTILFWDFTEANVINNSIETNDEELNSKLRQEKEHLYKIIIDKK